MLMEFEWISLFWFILGPENVVFIFKKNIKYIRRKDFIVDVSRFFEYLDTLLFVDICFRWISVCEFRTTSSIFTSNISPHVCFEKVELKTHGHIVQNFWIVYIQVKCKKSHQLGNSKDPRRKVRIAATATANLGKLSPVSSL